jgi:hypothetical protein
MMNPKVILQLMVFSLAFTMLVTRQAWGEEDCYQDKEVKSKCKNTIRHGGDYVQPSVECCATVRKSNMACICRNLSADNPVAVGSKCGGMYQILFILLR